MYRKPETKLLRTDAVRAASSLAEHWSVTVEFRALLVVAAGRSVLAPAADTGAASPGGTIRP